MLEDILKVVMIMIMGILTGFVIAHQYHQEDIKDFQREAVAYECGFWNVQGEFDWKSPELTVVRD